MKIMYQPEFLPYHQRVALELTIQKDNQHSIHGEYSGLFLLFFLPIGDFKEIWIYFLACFLSQERLFDKEMVICHYL